MITAADRLRAEGRVEGRVEGKAEGKLNNARKTAKKLFRMGVMSEEQIKEVTELSNEEIEKIKAEVVNEKQS